MPRRSHYDMLVEIVTRCQEPITESDLYHLIKSSHDIYSQQRDTALRYKLIKKVPPNKYESTPKGRDFLAAWSKVQTFLAGGMRR